MLAFIATLLFLIPSSILAISPVKRIGTRFFVDSPQGEQFFLKGVIYVSAQVPERADVLSLGSQCEIDAPLIRALGANTISFNRPIASADHDDCMAAFAANGIYVLVIIEDDPNLLQAGWTSSLLRSYTSVVDAFQQYNNTLGFIVDNRGVSANSKTLTNAPIVKSAIRDLKKYIKGKNYRQIPVGSNVNYMDASWNYASNYYACQIGQSEDDSAVDFIGVQHYSTCIAANLDQDGYSRIVTQYSTWNTPVFFSEKGCYEDFQPRRFDDQTLVFGPQLDYFMSGSVMFEWGNSKFGVVNYTSKGNLGIPIIKTDYSVLSSRWATLTGDKVTSPATTSVPTVTCPPYSSGSWPVSAVSLLAASGIDNVATITNTGIVKSTAITGKGTATSVKLSSTGSPTDGSNSNNGSNTDRSKSSIPMSAIIGIGVGLGIALLLLAAGAWFYRKSRGRRKLDPSHPNYTGSRRELYGGIVVAKSSGKVKGKAEMMGTGRVEMTGVGKPPPMELATEHDEVTNVYELHSRDSPDTEKLVGYARNANMNTLSPMDGIATEKNNFHLSNDRIASALSPMDGVATENNNFQVSEDRKASTNSTAVSKRKPLPASAVFPLLSPPQHNPPDYIADALAEEADVAVQELGVISVRKRTLVNLASSMGVTPDALPGRKGEEYHELLRREDLIRRTLDDIERQRRTGE